MIDDAALAALIAERPDDASLYLPYGDYLAERGDPFGEAIAIGRQLAANPAFAHALGQSRQQRGVLADAPLELKKIISAWRKLEPSLLGRLADRVTNVDWFLGFIRSCRIEPILHMHGATLADLLALLFDDPGPGRFVQNLEIFDSGIEPEAIAALARRPRRSLQRLLIHAAAFDDTALAPALPNLRTLIVLVEPRSRFAPTDLPPLPNLEHLHASTPNTSRSWARHATGWELLAERR